MLEIGIKIQRETILMLKFTDDIILLSENNVDLGKVLNGTEKLLRAEI